MILYINTSQRENIEFAIIKDREVFLLQKNTGLKQSEQALFLLDSFLKKNKIKLSNISRIVVNRGPGSFTAVRLGIVLANTLSFALNIPVVGVDNLELKNKEDYLGLSKLKFGKDFIKPYYDREPDITKSKKIVSIKPAFAKASPCASASEDGSARQEVRSKY